MNSARTFANLFTMGHCAPTVIRTLGETYAPGEDWLVTLSAGMPGGIGNTGHECGAVTSSLVLLGLRCGLRDLDDGLPIVFDCSHALCRRFLDRHKTLQCEEIRGDDRFPGIASRHRSCARPIRGRRGSRCARFHSRRCKKRLRARVLPHGAERFPLRPGRLSASPRRDSATQDLMDATSAFIGGTAFMGQTCSAFTAGVMALGLSRGEVENSVPRVVRMLAMMTFGGNALAADVNKFNPSLMRGYRLSRWFVHEFGSTQCRAITHSDFATASGVEDYIGNTRIASCATIADKVAAKVERMLSAEAAAS